MSSQCCQPVRYWYPALYKFSAQFLLCPMMSGSLCPMISGSYDPGYTRLVWYRPSIASGSEWLLRPTCLDLMIRIMDLSRYWYLNYPSKLVFHIQNKVEYQYYEVICNPSFQFVRYSLYKGLCIKIFLFDDIKYLLGP